MHKLSSKIISSGAVVVFMAILLLTPISASAASNSLGVNPRRDYIIEPGKSVSGTLNVTNLNKTDNLNVSLQVIDFGAMDETGSPKLLLGQKEPTRWSIKPYLKIADNIQLSAGKSTDVPFTITIPAKLGAGSFYGAIKYSTAGNDESGSNVSLTSSAATLVFVRVPGEARNALRLKSFGAFTPDTTGKSGTFGSFYGGQPPKYLAYRLTNVGNVAEQPTGSVSIKNVFGKKVKIYEKANPSNSVVLLEQTRRFDLCLNPEQVSRKDAASGREIEEAKCNGSGLFPGRYTAQLALVYGDNGSSQQELRQVASFWYLPAWFIGAVVAGIALVAGVGWLALRGIRGNHARFSSRR